jgi:hypothetical protein
MANDKKLLREQAADFGNSAEVVLGDTSYVIVPQRIGYLRSRIGVVLMGIMDLEVTGDNVVDALGSKVFGVLQVFIPDLMPEWEFQGFATREAMEKNEYNPEYDKSPTPTQIKRALMSAAEVNEIDLLKHLGKLIGPDLIRSWLAGALADSMQENSPKLPPTNGASSGTTSPTSVPTSG